MALDQMVANQNQYKRFFIAIEGFTDRVGSVDYNNALSRRRADAVMAYLIAEHDIPVYRVHMIGLGQQKPVDDGRGRAANAKNRRVEVTLFSADQNLASNNQSRHWSARSNPAQQLVVTGHAVPYGVPFVYFMGCIGSLLNAR